MKVVENSEEGIASELVVVVLTKVWKRNSSTRCLKTLKMLLEHIAQCQLIPVAGSVWFDEFLDSGLMLLTCHRAHVPDGTFASGSVQQGGIPYSDIPGVTQGYPAPSLYDGQTPLQYVHRDSTPSLAPTQAWLVQYHKLWEQCAGETTED